MHRASGSARVPGGCQEAAAGNRRDADANSLSLPIGTFHTDRLPGA